MSVRYKFVLAGDTGTGKTAQFRTMPGRRFAQLFDPAAASTLAETDCECEWWLPRAGELAILPRRDVKKQGGLYTRWATDFNKKLRSGFFDDIDSFMLDSVTMLGQACLDEELARGPADERQAYRFAGETLVEALWAICSLPCHVLLTIHTKFEGKEGEPKEHKLTIPGGAKLYLPRLVSALWFTSVTQDGTSSRYQLLTKPQRFWPHVRTPHIFSYLSLYHDVTIEDWDFPGNFGLGALLI